MATKNLGDICADDHNDDPVIMASVQGAFYGVNLPSPRLEGLIAAHIPYKHIADVADVYQTKWWDYRRLTPGHSFHLFAHHYYRAYKIASKKLHVRDYKGRKDYGLRGAYNTEFTVDTIWDRTKPHMTGVWKSMMTADSLGIPYDFYCRAAFEAAIEMFWSHLPSPAQMYCEAIAARVLEAWEEGRRRAITIAKHPIYLVEHYAGKKLQDDYRRWVLSEVLCCTGNPINAIAQIVYRKPQLPEAMVAPRFSKGTMSQAKQIVN